MTAGASDVRYLLEANVRSTQLAFQHNQRTLEAGLRMADTLREGIQSLAETQADWSKSLVGSRGFLRNSATPQLAALPVPVQPEQDTEEDEEEEQLPVSGTERAMELGLAVVTLINNFMTRPAAVAAPKQDGAKFDARSLFDWQHAARRGESAPAARGARETAPHFNSPAEVMAALPPNLVRKLFDVRAELTAEEQSRLMELLSAIPSDELPAIAAHLEPMSTEEVVAMVRTQLATPVKGD